MGSVASMWFWLYDNTAVCCAFTGFEFRLRCSNRCSENILRSIDVTVVRSLLPLSFAIVICLISDENERYAMKWLLVVLIFVQALHQFKGKLFYYHLNVLLYANRYILKLPIVIAYLTTRWKQCVAILTVLAFYWSVNRKDRFFYMSDNTFKNSIFKYIVKSIWSIQFRPHWNSSFERESRRVSVWIIFIKLMCVW